MRFSCSLEYANKSRNRIFKAVEIDSCTPHFVVKIEKYHREALAGGSDQFDSSHHFYVKGFSRALTDSMRFYLQAAGVAALLARTFHTRWDQSASHFHTGQRVRGRLRGRPVHRGL